MHYSDRSQLGWLILRHHDPLVDADLRNVPGALHQVGYDDEGKPAMEAPGDLSGGAVWRAKPGERFDMAAHFLTGAPVTATPPSGATGTGGNWSLLRAVDTPDTRLETKNLAGPAWAKGTFPKGHTGQASAAVEESTQIDLLHPDFWGLYSPQRNGPSSAGTYVYDLRDDGSPDPVRSFQLQQFVRVGDLGAGLCGFSGKVPALQLGVEDLDVKSGGLPFAEGRNLGLGSWLAGGPFTVGVGLCQHAKAGPDGHMSPLHLATESLFLGAHDGPLDFRGQIDVDTADQDGVWQRVHLDWDPEVSHIAGCGDGFGKWRWRVRLPHFVGEPPRQPPPGDRFPPPTTELPPPPTGAQPDPENPQDVVTGLLAEWAKNRTQQKDTTGVISDGTKRTESTSPYVQTAPGFSFKPQFPGLGATHAYDAVSEWFSSSPQVAQFVAFGNQSGTEFAITDGTDYSHPTGQGGFAILPPDVDPFAVFRGETVTSNFTPQIVIPNGLAQLGFGTVGTNGLTQSGMLVEVGTGGRLDIKTVDSTGAVTATAYIPSGASGDISGAAGSGDVTGPAGATAGNLPQLDATGKVISDSGIAAADVSTTSGTLTQDDLVKFDSSGNVVASGVQYDDVVAVTPSAYALIQGNSGGTAWAATTQLDAQHDPNSISWGSPAHFIQNTDNQPTALDLPALELATPNHLANTVSSGKGGTGLSFTQYGGTPVGGIIGNRTSSLAGDLYFGGTEGGAVSKSARAFANYSSTDGFAIEGDGFTGWKDVLSSDPAPTLTTGSDYGFQYMKDGKFTFRNVGGDPFTLGEPYTPDATPTLQTSTDGTIAAMSGDTATAAEPGSGSTPITISTPFLAGIVYNIVLVVDTALTGTLTGFSLGDGTDADRFGVASTVTANTVLERDDWTVSNEQQFGFYVTQAQASTLSLYITPVGGNWGGGGNFTVVFQQQFTTAATY